MSCQEELAWRTVCKQMTRTMISKDPFGRIVAASEAPNLHLKY